VYLGFGRSSRTSLARPRLEQTVPMLPRVHGFEHALSRWVHEVLPHVEAVEVVAIEILVRDDLHRRNRGIGNDVAYALARTDVGTFLIQFDGELHVGWATAERVVLLEP